MSQPLDRHTAKIVIMELLVAQAKNWTFEWPELPVADRIVLKDVRDEYVKQLEGNVRFARKAAR